MLVPPRYSSLKVRSELDGGGRAGALSVARFSPQQPILITSLAFALDHDHLAVQPLEETGRAGERGLARHDSSRSLQMQIGQMSESSWCPPDRLGQMDVSHTPMLK